MILEEKIDETSLCPSERMFTANDFAAQKVELLDAVFAMQTRINGGESDTEVKEFAVKPRGAPTSSSVVTTVTPVRNAPRALRNSRGSKLSPIRTGLSALASRLL
jgi:hypothetical protein